jgi:hypothetical protein
MKDIRFRKGAVLVEYASNGYIAFRFGDGYPSILDRDTAAALVDCLRSALDSSETTLRVAPGVGSEWNEP